MLLDLCSDDNRATLLCDSGLNLVTLNRPSVLIRCLPKTSLPKKLMSEYPYDRDQVLDLLKINENFPAEINLKDQNYILDGDYHLGEGLYSVVWKAADERGRPRALKFCPSRWYEHDTPEKEAIEASKLEGCSAFATFVDVGTLNLKLGSEHHHELFCFVEHYVDGDTLEDFLRKSPEAISPSFIKAYVEGMCVGLHALRQVGLSHDDLHERNVMISEPALGDLRAERSIKIIDTGRIKSARFGQFDDHRFFVEHLVKLWNCVRRKREVVVRDRRFLRDVLPLLRQMLETDATVALRDPLRIHELFQSSYQRAMAPPREEPTELRSPFEFISADHIADDRLLVEIFANSCPWLESVSGPDPCLVTGPRGCGKSTIFRWLSLKAHLHKPSSEIESDLRVTGFYISCSADLQNRLSWIQTEADAKKFRSLIIHYFNLVAAREVVKTLCMIGAHQDAETYWGLGGHAKKVVYEFFVSTINGTTESFRLAGVPYLELTQELIENHLFKAQLAIQNQNQAFIGTNESFLGDLTSLLTANVSKFQSKKLVFLVDDFSTHRIPEVVQTILNKIVWERRPSHVFKLSSEKHGAILNDELLATSELTRERIEIDCGREFLNLNSAGFENRATQFTRELLDNRLRAAKFAGDAETLIGESSWVEGSLGKALRPKRQNPRPGFYHGLPLISQLCSGDVASILRVFASIFDSGNVNQSTTSLIPKHVQHKAIVQVSRDMRELTKSYFPKGPELYKVIMAFGNAVRNVMKDGNTLKSGEPSLIPRIEIDQPSGDAIVELNEEAQSIAWELVRRAIFIEMQPGISRHKSWSTLRWNIRRIYLPSFGAALAKNDAVKKKPIWLQQFLIDPEPICEAVVKNWKDDDDQLKLFER